MQSDFGLFQQQSEVDFFVCRKFGCVWFCKIFYKDFFFSFNKNRTKKFDADAWRKNFQSSIAFYTAQRNRSLFLVTLNLMLLLRLQFFSLIRKQTWFCLSQSKLQIVNIIRSHWTEQETKINFSMSRYNKYYLTHQCRPVRLTFAVRETASLGIMGEPRVPPLNPSESIVLWEHYRLWGV